MALTIPHNSQAGIAVASGGRAANYVGAGAFMTPGQSAMPNALNHLSRGIDRLGGAVNEMLLDRRRMQNATDLLADQNAEKDAYRAFREDYEKNNQGAGAREAAQAAEQYFQTRMEGLRGKWGGNPWLMQAVDQMMAPIRAGGLEHAEAYSDQQEKLYMRAESDKAFGEAMLDFADPGKTTQELGASLGGYEASLRMMHGQRQDPETGQWVGGIPEAVDADLMQARQKLYSAHADSLIAANRLGEARAFVHANARELGGRAGRFEVQIEAEGKRREAEYRATRDKEREDREWAVAARLAEMPEAEAARLIAGDPALKDDPEAQVSLSRKYRQIADIRKVDADRQSERQISGVYADMRALKDKDELDEASTLRLVLSLPPEKQGAAMSYGDRLAKGDTVETDPRVFTEIVRDIGRGAPANVAKHAGAISFTDQAALEDPQRGRTLAALLPVFEQAAARRGLTEQETAEAFASFQSRVPAEGFKTQQDADNAMFRDLNYVTLDKPWSVTRTVRGYKAAAWAADGFYPSGDSKPGTSSGAEAGRFRAWLAENGKAYELMTEAERGEAYRIYTDELSGGR